MQHSHSVTTERRRGQRIRLSVAIKITSLEPSVLFGGTCNTLAVSFYGCEFFVPRPFKYGARLRLEVPETGHTIAGRVVHAMLAESETNLKLWKIGVEFRIPGNYWGKELPP